MSSPELLNQQIERWLEDRKNKKESDSTIDIKSTQEEIIKLQSQEDRFANAYSKKIISLEQLEQYVAPLRIKIREFENQIFQAGVEKMPKNDISLPSESEIEVFAKEVMAVLDTLKFASKKAIINQIIDKVSSTQKSLDVYGLLNLNEIYVIFFSEYRNCWFAECGEVHIV